VIVRPTTIHEVIESVEMRRLGLPLWRIVSSLLFGATILAGASSLAWAEPDCQVIGLRGSATLEREGTHSPLATGAELGMGDWIATDAGARVKLRFADGSLVQLGENTRLRIDLAKFDPAEGTRNILLNLPMGLLRAAAAKLPSTTGSSFEIHTGIGYSAVRGTEWIMVATSEETRVYVQEGRVSVAPTSRAPGSPNWSRPATGWLSAKPASKRSRPRPRDRSTA
jgi:hypothetical protein